MTTRFALFATTLAATAGPRVANTTINLPPNPPTSVIEVADAFPGVSFSQPVCLRSPTGETRRLFVCEKTGDLELIPDVTSATPAKTVFLDLDQILATRGEALLTGSEQGLLAVAFHPNYADNGHFFTVYNVSSGGSDYQRLSRWTDPDRTDTVGDPASEEILIEMLNDAGNHNGGDLHFGPDDYLYMSWGDEGGANDLYRNSQYLDQDFWSSVTRIDVNLEPEDYTEDDGTGSDDDNVRPNSHPAIKLVNGNPLYEIPADNPLLAQALAFTGVAVDPLEARTEFFAIGLRNPWRMSFDGDELWIGDVGQGSREEVTIVTIGSNHGWAWFEGDENGVRFNQTINGVRRTDATLTAPVYDYTRGSGPLQGRSITGGFVYRGNNIPDLTGKYIFADYATGNIWSLLRTEIPGEPIIERIAGEGGIACFGPDPSNGDILMGDLNNGVIRRLIAEDLDPSFPDTLSATGIFSDLTNLTPNAGLVPYGVNLPFWSDHATKQRWFALKNTTDLVQYSEKGPWKFPAEMVWVKHFDLELERGNPASKKRIETRVIVKNETPETSSSTTLLAAGAQGRYFVPTNSSLEETWMMASFDDSGWTTANTGIGYDENPTYQNEFGDGGNLGNSLNGQNTSFYLRLPFAVNDAAGFDTLTLRMKYDDGFAAFLNGQPLASANAPSNLQFDSDSEGDNDDANAVIFQDFVVDVSLLQEGANVLAIQGLNGGLGSSDMLINPELVGGITTFRESIYGVSYKWNDEGTEASLAPSAGENFDLTITENDEVRRQTWTIPSRAACNSCHTPDAGFALSFNTPQLNRTGAIEGTSGNLLSLLHASGYLDKDPGATAALPRHIGPEEIDYSLEARVRSYLDVNCAYCHQIPGIQPESWRGNHNLTLAETGLINGIATGDLQDPTDRLVVPGNTDRSILLNRVAATNGYTRMPALATNELDEKAIQLLTDWITQEATSEVTYDDWREAKFGNISSPDGNPEADPDHDGNTNQQEWLALTDPNDSSDFLKTNLTTSDGNLQIELPRLATRSVIVERSTNLNNWLRWTIPENDGIARNPATPPQFLTAPAVGTEEYFRLKIEAR